MSAQTILRSVESSVLWQSPGRWQQLPGDWPEAAGLDIVWYARQHRNLFGPSTDPSQYIGHYLRNAAGLRLSPNLAFDEAWYQIQHQGAAAAVQAGKYRSGWEHYCTLGAQQQLNPTFWFDERWYQRRYPEVAEAVQRKALSCGFEHYLLYGLREDAAPSLYFNSAWYRQTYMSGRKNGVRNWPIVEYLLTPLSRRPSPVPFFEPEWYAHSYLTLSAPEAGDAAAPQREFGSKGAFEHYLLYGRRRRNSPSPYFDERAYLEAYPEVAKLVTAGPYQTGFEHYADRGVADGYIARSHLHTGGVDYAAPQYLESYEKSLRINLRQLSRMRELLKVER